MKQLARITLDPAIMGGKACIRRMRVTVATVVGLLASGRSREEILQAYPYLELEDIDQALAYAAWRVEERELSMLALGGNARNDPDFDLYLEEIQRYRQEVDQ
jgi:uncharacterized protein (DUF433 family)